MENNISAFNHFFYHKNGLEIGGPSGLFSDELPVYNMATSIDGCNFSKDTIWNNTTSADRYHYSDTKSGLLFILEGTDLSAIKDGEYDFVLSSHNLEHIANPLKAVQEWVRVIQPGGVMLLVLPDKESTFDHRRPYTTFAHLLSDFEAAVGEADLTHLSEILELHDLNLDPGAGDFEYFKRRGEDNLNFRALHHHVFSPALVAEIATYFGLNIRCQDFRPPYHQITILQRPFP
jgi:SAM-dependent methyltransferase